MLFIVKVASGMQELAKLGIVHRDLAARNIMLDKWLQVHTGSTQCFLLFFSIKLLVVV